MDMPSLRQEAAHCREKAIEFSGQPEEHFLLKLASAMEELALVQRRVDVIASANWTVAKGLPSRAKAMSIR